MTDSNDADAIAELLTLTVEVNERGARIYRNSLGQRHRVHGPAVECADGTKAWCLNGLRHREDGPAIEWGNGRKSWWLNGKHLSEEEFHDRTK